MKPHIPTLLATASGLMVDLMHPRPEMVLFPDIAEHLAKEPRYNGATPGRVYSVAEHLCRGADAFLAQGKLDEAAAFLIHDAHEAYLKDDTTPKKRAIARLAVEHGAPQTAIDYAFNELPRRWDRAIHAAAGLIYPLPQEEADAVHAMDRIMLATEWRDLMPANVACPFADKPLFDIIAPWRWDHARISYLRRCERLLPALLDAAGAERGGRTAGAGA